MQKIRGAYVITTLVVADESGLKAPVRDAIIKAFSNDAVRCDYDLAFGLCYPGGPLEGRQQPADPVSGQAVYDASGLSSATAQKANLVPTDPIRYSGGGWYFGDSLYPGARLEISADVAADIWSQYSGKSQRFAVVCYIKTPSKENWYSAANQAVFLDIGNGQPSAGTVSMITLGQVSGQSIRATRQTNGAGTVVTNLAIPDEACDRLVQVSYVRDDSGVTLRAAWDGGSTQIKVAVGSDNVGNFSACKARFGFPGTYSAYPLNAYDKLAAQMKAYRIFVANLARYQPEDILSVIDADLARVISRGDFS